MFLNGAKGILYIYDIILEYFPFYLLYMKCYINVWQSLYASLHVLLVTEQITHFLQNFFLISETASNILAKEYK